MGLSSAVKVRWLTPRTPEKVTWRLYPREGEMPVVPPRSLDAVSREGEMPVVPRADVIAVPPS